MRDMNRIIIKIKMLTGVNELRNYSFIQFVNTIIIEKDKNFDAT